MTHLVHSVLQAYGDLKNEDLLANQNPESEQQRCGVTRVRKPKQTGPHTKDSVTYFYQMQIKGRHLRISL